MPSEDVDRAAIEAALPADIAEALPQLCRLWEVAPERWPCIPTLRTFLVHTAARAEVEAGTRRGLKEAPAIRQAAGRLGLSAGTLRSQIQRDRRRRLGRE